MHVIAAKAVAFKEALQPSFKEYQQQILKNANAMAEQFIKRGYKVVSGGTDDHLFLVDFIDKGITGKDVDAAVAVDSAGGIYVRDSDPILIGRIVEWLQQQPWCGPVLTRNGEKSLKLEMAGLDHPRAPDIALVLKSNDSENEYGIRGGCMNNSTFYPVGGGLHGGLNALELKSWK